MPQRPINGGSQHLPPIAVRQRARWRPFPARGRLLIGIRNALGLMLCLLAIIFAASTFPGFTSDALARIESIWLFASMVVMGLTGLLAGQLRHRQMRWWLGRGAFAIRSGRLVRQEVHVAFSRVQRIEIRSGPLARRRRLASLVIHTAGVRDRVVVAPLMDHRQATKVRDLMVARAMTAREQR